MESNVQILTKFSDVIAARAWAESEFLAILNPRGLDVLPEFRKRWWGTTASEMSRYGGMDSENVPVVGSNG